VLRCCQSTFTHRVVLTLGDAKGGAPGSNAHLREKGKGKESDLDESVLLLVVKANTHRTATCFSSSRRTWGELGAGGVQGRKTGGKKGE